VTTLTWTLVAQGAITPPGHIQSEYIPLPPTLFYYRIRCGGKKFTTVIKSCTGILSLTIEDVPVSTPKAKGLASQKLFFSLSNNSKKYHGQNGL
jgi:hypothetical protein